MARVTAAVRLFHREALVRIVPTKGWTHTIREWELTPAGETWLKANGGSTS